MFCFQSAIPVTDSSVSSRTSGLISWAASFPATQILPTNSQEKTSTSSQASNDEKSLFTAAFPSADENASSGQNKMSQSSLADPPALDLLIPDKGENVSEEKSQVTHEQVTSVSASSFEHQPQQTPNITTEEDFEVFLERNMPNSLTGKLQRAPIQVEEQSQEQEFAITPSQPVILCFQILIIILCFNILYYFKRLVIINCLKTL